MKFTFFHNNINVLDLDKSVEFYKKALGLEVTKEFHAPDGSFKLSETAQHHIHWSSPGFATWTARMISEITNLIWHSMSMTWTLPWHFTKKWIACVSKTRTWEFISSMILTATG